MKQDKYEFENTRFNLQTSQKVWKVVSSYMPRIKTALDLGCGMGAWSTVLEDDPEISIQMVDHPQLPKENLLVTKKECFVGIDLDKELPLKGRWDLVICIEVLEHFKEQRALDLKDFIVQSTDLVLFSAAIPGQGGVGHVNCQRHSYWHNQFQKAGFTYFDGFKSAIIHEESIPFWIRQNLFIYYRPVHDNQFKGKLNYTPANFELIHAGMLRNEIGLRMWLKLAPKLIGNYFKKLLKGYKNNG